MTTIVYALVIIFDAVQRVPAVTAAPHVIFLRFVLFPPNCRIRAGCRIEFAESNGGRSSWAEDGACGTDGNRIQNAGFIRGGIECR
jgi:hypothetical protein